MMAETRRAHLIAIMTALFGALVCLPDVNPLRCAHVGNMRFLDNLSAGSISSCALEISPTLLSSRPDCRVAYLSGSQSRCIDLPLPMCFPCYSLIPLPSLPPFFPTASYALSYLRSSLDMLCSHPAPIRSAPHFFVVKLNPAMSLFFFF